MKTKYSELIAWVVQEIFHEAKPSEIACLISAICMSNSTVTVLFGINMIALIKTVSFAHYLRISRLATFPRLRVASVHTYPYYFT